MADPLVVLLVVVGATSAAAPRSSPVAAAIREALGEEATVMVEERSEAPSREAAQELAGRLRASAVAELSWADGEGRAARAHVDMFMTADRAWHERDLGFEAGGTRDERERALGLFLGALVRAAAPETQASAAASAPEATGPSPQAFAPAPPRERRAASAPEPRATRWAVAPEAAFAAAGVVGAEASGVGPGIGLDVGRGAFGARASGALRLGTVSELDATSSLVRLGLGPRARVLATAEEDVTLTVA